MNLGQLRIAVDRRSGIGADELALQEFINEANFAIAADHDWPWLQRTASFSTIAGTDTYATPSDWLRSLSLRIPDEIPMERRSSIVDMETRDPWTTSRGEPDEWCVYGDALVLRPVPDGIVVVTHRYVRQEPELGVDSDTPLMPALFHPAIVQMACAIIARRRGDSREASFLAAYGDWRNRMVDDQRRSRGSVKVKLRSRW